MAGTAVGANLFVPPGSGLAAGPTALGYGVVGALTAVFIAILLAWKLPASSVRRLALWAIMLSALVVAFVGYRIFELRAARLAGAGLDAANPQASPVHKDFRRNA